MNEPKPAQCPNCLRVYPPFLLARHVRRCQGVAIALNVQAGATRRKGTGP